VNDPGNPSAVLSLPFVQVHELQDAATGHRWQVSISHAGSSGAVGGHRLLVLLDGNLSAVPAALMLHTRMDRVEGDCMPCTVVGVGYAGARFYDLTQRARDYLPPLPSGLDPVAWQGGQADAFSSFLDSRLLLWLEAQRGVAFTEVGLFGHSYGGLFTLYKLLHHPGRFHAFFSISPSLWWADGHLLDHLSGAGGRCAGRTLFLGIGADERAMPGDDAQRVAVHHERDLQGRFARLVEALQSQDVSFQAETFAGEDHGSVVYPAMTRAVRWLVQAQAHHNTHETDRPLP